MSATPHSFFLGPDDGFAGPRFALLHQPPAEATLAGAIVYLHPIGEEMNRSRRMVALQAWRLAAAGWAVLQIDLAGCGDSAGLMADATWEGWVHDATQASAWLQAHTGHTPWLWGLRTGALLAASAAQRMATPPHLLLWQPVVDGSHALRQWLRIGAEAGSGVAQRQQALLNGQAVAVGGYTLSPQFAQEWAASRLQPQTTPQTAPSTAPQTVAQPAPVLIWLDVSADGAALPAHAAALPAWRAAHWQVAHTTLTGPAFWASAETECVPALLAATDAAMAACARPAARALDQHHSHPHSDHLPAPAPAPRSGTPTVDGARERAVHVRCGNDTLIGLLSQPATRLPSDLGLVIVVGGPQVRCGAHRMFTQLARHVAAHGHTALRFDLRGMGDSDGEPRPFDDRNADLQAAVAALRDAAPHVRRVLLWGLCDGASAALLFAGGLQTQAAPAPVQGLCLVNPWARSPVSLAQTRLAHHYRARLTSPSFWWRALRGRVSPRALGGWLRASWQARRSAALPVAHFTTRMAAALHALHALPALPALDTLGAAAPGQPGPVGMPLQLITAEADETAQEFHAFLRSHAPGPLGTEAALPTLPKAGLASLAGADHTFSKPGQMDWLCNATSRWMDALQPIQPQPAPGVTA